jgi:hypothetical protein
MGFLFGDACSTVIKFQGTDIKIATIKGPAALPVEVRGVGVNQHVLQAAGQIAQILDLRQYQNCQTWKAMRKLKVDDNKKLEVLIKMNEDVGRLTELAILASANYSSADEFEKALSQWIASAHPQAVSADKELSAQVRGIVTPVVNLPSIMQKATSTSPYLRASMTKATKFSVASALNLDVS